MLVWLHGGGWSTGSASWPLYEFDNLARNHDVVVVGVNHRLGILGFLDLSGLGEEFADSGNAGMLDVVAALEWVRDNIARFGGDPGNVTVFGESGGGAKTSALMAMPAARGLFHRAAPMSGALLTAQTPDTAAGNTATALEHLGLGNDVEKLRAVEVERLVAAELAVHARDAGTALRIGGFSPVLGPSLPEHPVAAVRSGSARDVAVVMGCTSDEMMAFLAGDPELWTLDRDGLTTRLGTMLGNDVERVLGAYRAAQPDASPTSLLIAIATDRAMRIPHVRLAEAKLAGGGEPAHMYVFGWGNADPTGRIRAGPRLRHALLLRQPRQGARVGRPPRGTARRGDERCARGAGAHRRPEPRGASGMAAVHARGSTDDVVRRRVASGARPARRGATRMRRHRHRGHGRLTRMDFVETPEHELLRTTVRDLAASFGHDYYAAAVRNGTHTPELWQAVADHGFLGVHLPEEHGGGGGGITELTIVCEELAAQGCPLLLILVSAAICSELISRFGSDEQRKAWLPGMIAGEKMAFAITEPDAGSNTHRLSTTATRDGELYRLRGTKTYISGVDEAARMVVVARTGTDEETGEAQLSILVVDTDAPGLERTLIPVEVGTPEKQFQLFFDDVEVGADRLVGTEGDGLRQVFFGLNPERITGASICTGIGRYALAARRRTRASARCGTCRSARTRASRTRSPSPRSSSSSRA